MDTGLPRTRRAERGLSLLEFTVAMGVSGLLALVGLSRWDSGHVELTAAQHELVESLDQAFVLARARGTNITVGPGTGKDPNHLPLQLGRKVKWGKPASIPLPPGMDDPVRADALGEAHSTITVTPRRTATASVWFLNDGEDAICMRLSAHGRIHLLRWKARARRWTRL